MVMVVGLRKAAGPAGAEEGSLGGAPIVRVGMVHEDGPFRAVIVAVPVNVRFQFAEERKDLFVTPLAVAPGCPGIKIFGNATIKS